MSKNVATWRLLDHNLLHTLYISFLFKWVRICIIYSELYLLQNIQNF